MAHVSIWACGRQSMFLLSLVEYFPGICEQKETYYNENVADYVKQAEMRVPLQTEECVQEMACIMRQQVDSWIAASQPAREQIDSKGKTVHLCEQCNYES